MLLDVFAFCLLDSTMRFSSYPQKWCNRLPNSSIIMRWRALSVAEVRKCCFQDSLLLYVFVHPSKGHVLKSILQHERNLKKRNQNSKLSRHCCLESESLADLPKRSDVRQIYRNRSDGFRNGDHNHSLPPRSMPICPDVPFIPIFRGSSESHQPIKPISPIDFQVSFLSNPHLSGSNFPSQLQFTADPSENSKVMMNGL